MKFADAARRFDNVRYVDAYTGSYCFTANQTKYNDSVRDSSTASRRLLNLEPGVQVPARRAVNNGDTALLIGRARTDRFFGRPVRVEHVVHEAPYLATVRTLGQECDATGGFTAYCGYTFAKLEAFEQQSSDLRALYTGYFSSNEPLVDNLIVTAAGRRFIVRGVSQGDAGFNDVTMEDLGDCLVSATVHTGTWNPLAETYGSGSTATTALKLRWQVLNHYGHREAPRRGPDSVVLCFPSLLSSIAAGTKVTLPDGEWMVSGVEVLGGAIVCQATHHGSS